MFFEFEREGGEEGGRGGKSMNKRKKSFKLTEI